MIALDTNLLVYSHRSDSTHHAAALAIVEELRASRAPWAIPWPCVHEFLSIVTHPKIFKKPTPLAVAFETIDAWCSSENLQLLAESEGCLQKLRRQVLQGHARGPLVHDARIAALCLHHGVRELWSADRDFTKFPALTIRNPLAS